MLARSPLFRLIAAVVFLSASDTGRLAAQNASDSEVPQETPATPVLKELHTVHPVRLCVGTPPGCTLMRVPVRAGTVLLEESRDETGWVRVAKTEKLQERIERAHRAEEYEQYRTGGWYLPPDSDSIASAGAYRLEGWLAPQRLKVENQRLRVPFRTELSDRVEELLEEVGGVIPRFTLMAGNDVVVTGVEPGLTRAGLELRIPDLEERLTGAPERLTLRWDATLRVSGGQTYAVNPVATRAPAPANGPDDILGPEPEEGWWAFLPAWTVALILQILRFLRALGVLAALALAAGLSLRLYRAWKRQREDKQKILEHLRSAGEAGNVQAPLERWSDLPRFAYQLDVQIKRWAAEQEQRLGEAARAIEAVDAVLRDLPGVDHLVPGGWGDQALNVRGRLVESVVEDARALREWLACSLEHPPLAGNPVEEKLEPHATRIRSSLAGLPDAGTLARRRSALGMLGDLPELLAVLAQRHAALEQDAQLAEEIRVLTRRVDLLLRRQPGDSAPEVEPAQEHPDHETSVQKSQLGSDASTCDDERAPLLPLNIQVIESTEKAEEAVRLDTSSPPAEDTGTAAGIVVAPQLSAYATLDRLVEWLTELEQGAPEKGVRSFIMAVQKEVTEVRHANYRHERDVLQDFQHRVVKLWNPRWPEEINGKIFQQTLGAWWSILYRDRTKLTKISKPDELTAIEREQLIGCAQVWGWDAELIVEPGLTFIPRGDDLAVDEYKGRYIKLSEVRLTLDGRDSASNRSPATI